MDYYDDSINKGLYEKICSNEIDHKCFQSGSFWHFMSVKTLKKVFPISKSSTCVLYGNSLGDLNDKEECSTKEDANRTFVICFTQNHSIHQVQLPMWYFYSEPEGNGVAFGITPKGMISLIQACSRNIVIGLVSGSSIKQLRKCSLKAEDCEVKCGWISYYLQSLQGNSTSQRRIVRFRNTDYIAVDNLPKKETHLVKSTLWSYENEFRIIITLTEEAYQRIQTETKSGKLKLGLNLSKINKDFLRLAFSPKLKDPVITTEMAKKYFGKAVCVEELEYVNLNLRNKF